MPFDDNSANKPLHRECRYFIENQDELVKRYGGKFVVIKGETVLGAYNSTVEAVKETAKAHKVGTFLVQRCEPGPECYTATFHGYLVASPD